MRWCQNCVLPDTRPNLTIGEDGICNACRGHGLKRTIDWASRAEQLRDVAAAAKHQASSNGYDCLIPVSGGKDSTWQVVKCLELGLRPLAVTWKTPARTAIGQRNLDNLVSLGVDHVDWQVNPKAEAKFMISAFRRFGSTAIPMHMALFNIPLTIATRFRIPLIVWGENSAFEYGARDEAHTGFRLDHQWLKVYGVTHGTTAEDWIDGDLSEKELASYFGPSAEDMNASNTRAIFLGYYLEWDPIASKRVAEAHGFRSDDKGPRTGLYDFADIDDDFISIHHWMKWYKFGFTRLFDNLSLEIRNGRMKRSQALQMLQQSGEQRPQNDILKFCEFAGITEANFYSIAETFRNLDIWQRRADGVWHLPNFLLPDWAW